MYHIFSLLGNVLLDSFHISKLLYKFKYCIYPDFKKSSFVNVLVFRVFVVAEKENCLTCYGNSAICFLAKCIPGINIWHYQKLIACLSNCQ